MPDAILFTLRLALGLVFGVAGVAKLADRAGAARALADFGVPSRLVAPAALFLPLAELGVAIALLPSTTARAAAVAALVLLLAFTAAIAYNLARGRMPECHCFGQLGSAPAGPRALARNIVLAAAAAVIVWHGPGAAPHDWLDAIELGVRTALVAVVALGAAVFFLGALVINLLRQHGRLLLRLDALERGLAMRERTPEGAPAKMRRLAVGAPAPDFSLRSIEGETITLAALRASGHPVVLAFVDPACRPCRELLPELAAAQARHARRLSVVFVSRGTIDANYDATRKLGVTLAPRTLLLQRDFEVAAAYGAPTTPFVVLVRPDGSIGQAAASPEEIRALVRRVESAVAVLRVGDALPVSTLPDLDGGAVTIGGPTDEPIALLMWDPACVHCSRMLPRLQASIADAPAGGPRLVLISRGSPEENRAMGLSVSIALDGVFDLGQRLGVRGTPSAILIDRAGRVASPVAIGADAVMRLLGVADPVALAGTHG